MLGIKWGVKNRKKSCDGLERETLLEREARTSVPVKLGTD